MTDTVWLAWSGDYDQRGVDGVYATRGDAVAGIMARYGPPAMVRWTERDGFLQGDFYEHVQGVHTKHKASWEFEEYPVEGQAESP